MQKKNIFKRFFCCIGRGLKTCVLFLEYMFLYIIVKPLMRCKIKGKNKVKQDEPIVFIANHYELYGPVLMFLRFPFKFRPWVIDKLLSKESVEQQMSLSVYNNFKSFPMWFKKIAVKSLRNLMIFTMNHAKAISVSRENPRENIKTLEESSKTLTKGTSILIFPEESYVMSGVGNFQTGFEHLAQYHHKKTGKSITFYPVFVSKQAKTIFIEDPITYNPENEPNAEKEKITSYLRNAIIDSYVKNECSLPYAKAKKLKTKKRRK